MVRNKGFRIQDSGFGGRISSFEFRNSILLLLAACHLSLVAGLGQQPQAQSAQPIYPVNAKYVNGVAPGFWPTAGTGLTLNISAGTAHCGNPPAAASYSGGSLTMTANATNHVYLDPAAGCTPESITLIASPPAAPSLSQVAGGSLPATTYYVKITYTNAHGETAASSESTLAVSANNLLQVAPPSSVVGATGWNVYVSWLTGMEIGQNSSPIAFGTSWTLPSPGLPILSSRGAAPTANSTGILPGEIAIAEVTTNSSTITNVTDLRTWFDSPNTQGPTVRADLSPGADAAAKISAAIGSLPASGGVVDARGLGGAQTLNSDMFAGTLKPGILLLSPSTTFTLNATQNVPAGWLITGGPGGYQADAGSGWPGRLGTTFRLGTASVAFKFNEVFRTTFENIDIDCNSHAGSVGIWYTGDNLNGLTSGNEFSHLGIYNCLYSFQVGNTITDTTYNPNQMDQFVVRRFEIFSNVPGAEAFTFNAANAAQGTIIEDGVIQLVNIGFDWQLYGGLAQVKRVVFGSLQNGPPLSIIGATNAIPIVITTSAAHGYRSGNRVQIAGVVGNTAANGNWYITVVDSTHFSLDNSAGNGAYTVGGTSTRLATSHNLASGADYWIEETQSEGGPVESFQNATAATNASPIVLTVPNHGYQTGDIVNVRGITGNTAADAMWQITRIDDNSFSLNGSVGNGSASFSTCTNNGPYAYVSGSCVQRVDSNFINVNGSPYNGAVITLLSNKLDEPIVVNRTARITSIGNYGGAPAVSLSSGAKIVSINDRFTNPGPMGGWDVSAGGQVLRVGGGDKGTDNASLVFPGGATLTGSAGSVVSSGPGYFGPASSSFDSNMHGLINYGSNVFTVLDSATKGAAVLGLNQSDVASNPPQGVLGVAEITGPGAPSFGVSGNAYLSNNANGAAYAISSYAESDSTGSVIELAGLFADRNVRNSGTVTNNYGIHIADQRGVGTNNYAIGTEGGWVQVNNGAIASQLATVTFSTTPTFDASAGNTQKITLTGNVTSSTLSNARAGEELKFVVCQDSTGNRTFAWPANVKGGMTIGSTASKCSSQSFIFDGTNAYATSAGVTGM